MFSQPRWHTSIKQQGVKVISIVFQLTMDDNTPDTPYKRGQNFIFYKALKKDLIHLLNPVKNIFY